MNPNFPIYIVSKGRAESGTTRKAFDKLGVPYSIIVEEQELEEYAKYTPRERLLVLPKRYLEEYDTFSDLGKENGPGPGPARNFAWEHSISIGAKWHWVMDDNISCFYRLNHNRRLPVGDGTIFRAMEDFCERYENVAIAGPNYLSHVQDRSPTLPPYILNTRIYSMLLIRNNIPFRWRGRYNEDTDLSIRVMKDGWCTIQFNAFLGDKATTQTKSGGNTAEFYAKEGTLNKSQMLKDMHPEITEVVWRHGRWHHEVSYDWFAKHNKLIRKSGIVIPEGVNNYGMKLIRVANE